MSEISGIVTNGLERGWQQAEIRQSLLNAGYTAAEVDSEISVFNSKATGSVVNSQPQYQQSKFNPQSLKNYQMPFADHRNEKKRIWLLLGALVLVGLIVGASLFFLLK